MVHNLYHTTSWNGALNTQQVHVTANRMEGLKALWKRPRKYWWNARRVVQTNFSLYWITGTLHRQASKYAPLPASAEQDNEELAMSTETLHCWQRKRVSQVVYPEASNKHTSKKKGASDLDPMNPGDTIRIKAWKLGKKEWEKTVVSKRLDERSFEVEAYQGLLRVYLRKCPEPEIKSSQPERGTGPTDLLCDFPEISEAPTLDLSGSHGAHTKSAEAATEASAESPILGTEEPRRPQRTHSLLVHLKNFVLG